MVSEVEAYGRYTAYGDELRQLDSEIDLLQLRVRMGSETWRADLELLAERAERRRRLAAQRQALRWVLALEGDEGERHAYG